MRQSPLIDQYDEADFEIGEVNGMLTALESRRSAAHENVVADVSAAPKLIVAGSGAADYLGHRQLEPPQTLLGVADSGGTAVIRLHRQQFLLCAGLGETADPVVTEIEHGRHGDVLVLPYECAELACAGPFVEPMIAELAAMDVEQSPNPAWIPTRFAHAEVVVRRFREPSHTRLVCSPADARFVFGTVRGVLSERRGGMVGYRDFADWLMRQQ